MADDTFAAWRAEVARELRTLAMLHAAEVDADVLARLVEADYPTESVLPIDDDDARVAVGMVREAIFELRKASSRELDDLAADYAAIYLTGALHVSPNESAWLDEDHLERQQPMFEVRAWYERHGLAAANWRCRAEDNLSLQLLFIATLLDGADEQAAAGDTAAFMDQHLLRWLGDFASGVATRCATRFYGALAIYTNTTMQALRAVIGEIAGIPPLDAEAVAAPATLRSDPDAQSMQAMPLRYYPGVAPSW